MTKIEFLDDSKLNLNSRLYYSVPFTDSMFYSEFVTLAELNAHLARPVSRKLIDSWVLEGKVPAHIVGSYKHRMVVKARGSECRDVESETLYSLGKAAEESHKMWKHVMIIGYTRGDEQNDKERCDNLRREHGIGNIEIVSDVTPNTSTFDFLMKRVKLRQIKEIVIQSADDIAVHHSFKVTKATLTRYNTFVKILDPLYRATPGPRPRASISLLDTPNSKTPSSRRPLIPLRMKTVDDEYLTLERLSSRIRCSINEKTLMDWDVRSVNGEGCKLYHLSDVKEKMSQIDGKAVGYARVTTKDVDKLQEQVDLIIKESRVSVVFTDVGLANDEDRPGFEMMTSSGASCIVILRMGCLFDPSEYNKMDDLSQNVMVLNKVPYTF
jgi:predicted site-specific integrase-resolvase